MGSRNLSIQVLLFFMTLALLLPIQANINVDQISPDQRDQELTTEANLKFIQDQISIPVFRPSQVSNGLNVFGLQQGWNNAEFRSNNSYLAITDLNGRFVKDPLVASDARHFEIIHQINATSFITQMSLDTDFEAERVMIWNTETDEIVSFDFVTNQHHDVRYNSETNTILVLEFYLDEIINATGILETMLVDRLVEYDLAGNVVWEFYLVDHTDFASYYEILNRTSRGRDNWIFNQTSYPDPTHTSSIFWDTDEDVIYINVRHFNQFWKVNHKTGGVVWKAGEAGNFTLIDDQGNEKNTLWYNSHDLTSLGDNEFLMFDNDFRNESVFSAEDHKSSILRIKINEETNEVVEVFLWVAPTAYYGFFWGGAQLLRNGNYLGSFGSLIHGPRGNEIHDDFGGAAIEVTPEGEVVWEMRLPYNWGFYRMRRIIPELNILSIISTLTEDGISIVVDSYSNFPQKYVFTLDGSFIEYKLWNGRGISEIFDRSLFRADLTAHKIEIIVFDAAGNTQRSTFMIDFEVSKPLMSSQSTESDSPVILPVTSSLILSLYTMHLRKRNRLDKSLE